MTTIALQSPWPVAANRIEKPAVATELTPVASVPALPDNATQGLLADRSAPRDRSRDNFNFRANDDQTQPRDTAPDPFPHLRFADPLPDLPDLDLPAKAMAYQAALSVLRNDDTA